MIDSVETRHNIRHLRKSQGLTVEEVAFRASMSERWVCTLESEQPTNTTIDTMWRIARALNVEPLVLDIFSLTDEEIRALAATVPEAPPQAAGKVHPGSNIVWLRKQRHMTQKQLAKAAGVSQAYLRNIEHGCANVSIHLLENIAKALGVSLFTLYALTIPVDDILAMVHAARALPGVEAGERAKRADVLHPVVPQ